MPPPEVTINVLVELDRIDEVAKALENAGLAIERRNPTIGTISGRVDSASVPTVRKTDGVIAIEADRSFSVPPPDSDLQ